MPTQLAPDDIAIAVVIELEHEVKIAQRDIPLRVHDGLRGACGRPARLFAQAQVSVARRMRTGGHARQPGCKPQQCAPGPRARAPNAMSRLHCRANGVAFNCASRRRASGSITGSCSFVARMNAMTALAA